MSDVNVAVSVSDESVDQAIAKIEGGLDKLSQLQSQMAVLGPDALASPAVPARRGSVGVAGAAAGVGAGVAGLSTAQAKVDKLKGDVAKTTADTENLLSLGKSSNVKGLQSAVYRITRRLPGLREAHRLSIAMKNLSVGNLVGVVGLITLVISIANQISNYFEEQKRQQQEYQQQIMQVRGFLTSEEYQTWYTQNRQAVKQVDRSYRNGEIP